MQLKLFYSYFLHILLIVLLFSAGCKRPKDSAIAVDDKTSLGTYYLDTFTVELSTVLVDSLPTSLNDKMFSGHYVDPAVGSFTAAPHFQFSLAGIDSDNNGREDILVYNVAPVFDSLVLQLNHVYSYGDTSNAHQMSVYRLTDDMHYGTGTSYIYNGMSFAHESSPLTTVNIAFSQASSNTIRINLNSLGTEFFNYAYNNDNRMATTESFKLYFKGFALIPDAANTSIFGYNRQPTLTLYYHDTDNPSIIKTYTFKHNTTTDLFFNEFKNDRSGTNLASLKEMYQEIPASQCNDESYVMTGVELMTKLKFPYLNEIRGIYPNFAVNKAELLIKPKANSYSPKFRLPTDLVMYRTSSTNIPGLIISYTGTSIAEVISPVVDYESNRETYYKFDVTDFMQDQLKTSFYDQMALMLTSPRSTSGNRTEKLVLDNNPNSYTITLKLYLTIF